MSVPPVRYPLSGVSERQRVSVQPWPDTDLNKQCPSAHITAQERRPQHACRGTRLWHQKTRAQVLTPIPEPLHNFSFPRISGLPCKGGRIPSSQRPSPFCLPSAPSFCPQKPTQSPPIGRTLAAVPRVPTTLNCTLSREESRPLGAGLGFPFVSPLSGSHLSAVPLTQLLAALRRTPRTEVVAADPAPPHPAPRRPRRHPGFPCPPLVRHLCILLSPWWAWTQRGAIPALGTAGRPLFCKQGVVAPACNLTTGGRDRRMTVSSRPVQAAYYTIFFFDCARLNSTYHFILIDMRD